VDGFARCHRGGGTKGHQLLIAHESLYYPYDVVIMANPPAGWESWKVNRQRRELLRNTVDLSPHSRCADEICIGAVFCRSAPAWVAGEKREHGMIRIYEIPECSLDRNSVPAGKEPDRAMPHLRVADKGFGARRVKRVGFPWGGFGLFVNVIIQQKLAALGCDVFITGNRTATASVLAE